MNLRFAVGLAASLATLATFAACGGGGGGGPVGGSRSSSLQLVLDTATGSDSLVQVQVVAAAMRRDDGTSTGNLLAGARMLTVADPGGAPAGLQLRDVPPGIYRELHLACVPGSGIAVLADGRHAGVDFPSADVGIRLQQDIAHDGVLSTWLAVRHATAASFQPGANGRIAWNPDLLGAPAAGTVLENATLQVSSVQGSSVHGSLGGLDDGPMHLEIEQQTELFDDHGQHVGAPGAFLGALAPGHELSVSGELDDHGGMRGVRVRHCSGGQVGPRQLGRITSLDPGTATFGLEVVAQVSHHEQVIPATGEHLVVHVGGAPIHQSHQYTVISFLDLRIGDLVRVGVAARNGNEITAREVELESRSGQGFGPEIEGRVGEVRAAEGRIVVVPRGNDPLVVGGQVVASVDVHVGSQTRIERRNGAATTVIPIGGVLAGERIAIRGTITGPTAVDANLVRVRAD